MLRQATIGTEGRRTLFPDAFRQDGTVERGWTLTDAVRTVARTGAEALILFCIVHDHLHLVGDERVGRVANAVSRSFRAHGTPSEHARLRPVNGRDHLVSLVGYVTRQVEHHAVGVHPVLWPGSCAWDLLGARILPGFDAGRIGAELPDEDVPALVREGLGLPARPPPGPIGPDIRARGAAALWRTCCAAAAVSPGSEPRDPQLRAARRVFAYCATRVGIHAEEARHAAAIPRSTWYDGLAEAPPQDLLAAARALVALEFEVAATSRAAG